MKLRGTARTRRAPGAIGLLAAQVLTALLLAAHAAAQDPGPLRLEGRGVPPPTGGPTDVTGAGLAFVELEAERQSTLVHEPVRIRLCCGLESEFLRTSLVQLFQRPLDVPVQVEVPWFDSPSGAEALAPEAAESAAPGLSLVLNGNVATARLGVEREIDGRRFVVFELERAFLPHGAGALAIPAPVLRFAYATRFEEDFVNGRVPRERRDALVRGAALAVPVLPLPEEGRPPDFSGAVGQFRVHATAEPRELALGSSLQLVLVIEGSGELAHATMPRLDGLADFHLQGQLDEARATGRAVVYHLAPVQSGEVAIPPVEFTFFDSTPPAGYRRLASEPIPIRVHPAAVSAPAAATEGPKAPVHRTPLSATGLLVIALVLALWLVLLVRKRAGGERS